MDPSSATIRHPEGYLIGSLLIVSLLPVMIPPVRVLGFLDRAVFVALGLMGLYGLYRAFSWERLDETGIFLKRPFFRRQYAWEQVRIVSLVPVNTGHGGRAPQLRLVLTDRRIRLRCTKDSLAVIRSFYGEPDEDLWGDGIS